MEKKALATAVAAGLVGVVCATETVCGALNPFAPQASLVSAPKTTVTSVAVTKITIVPTAPSLTPTVRSALTPPVIPPPGTVTKPSPFATLPPPPRI